MLLFSKTMTIDHSETVRIETNFLLSQVKSLQKPREQGGGGGVGGALAIPRYAVHASVQRDLFHASVPCKTTYISSAPVKYRAL